MHRSRHSSLGSCLRVDYSSLEILVRTEAQRAEKGREIQQGSFAASRVQRGVAELNKEVYKATKHSIMMPTKGNQPRTRIGPKTTSLGPRFEFWGGGGETVERGGENVRPRSVTFIRRRQPRFGDPAGYGGREGSQSPAKTGDERDRKRGRRRTLNSVTLTTETWV